MAFGRFCDFSANIRTHATIVGVITALDAILTLLLSVVLRTDDDLGENLKELDGQQDVVMWLGIIELTFFGIYCLGVIRQQRWCLTLFLVFVYQCFVLHLFLLVGAIMMCSIGSTVIMVTILGIVTYMLLVVHQLRSSISVALDADRKPEADSGTV
ncbi:uncharacterized protein LOC128268503 [Anopheles cruzii]|uniref:uncharacterized protein LOC128268503 n=1 Tax=Anopheles cruzii TaxID=68878 RepID=UPI0022EC90E3|nr:uncharacterized protein LOC128268503 [Anopheles cruzii]